MDNNIFPNNPHPVCTICHKKVVDSGKRAITKLRCQHFFHLDCIGSSFNMRGAMMCPNCLVDEGGKWIRCGDVEDDDDDEDNTNDDENSNNLDEFYGEDSFLSEEENDHRATAEAGGANNMRWIQQSSVPPPPIAPEMVSQRQISSSGSNVESGPLNLESLNSNEQACNNLLPCLELTLATHNSSRRMH
ncbi:hypothetical protein MTR67_024289 [Solanum verrucosum]|uniref:RING-type domain-containing protein n=1 Tax=Solanum verrucosum TaxID=315347 RepID=A0AAF0R3I5_SOLVR|nr:hypothetical protein MTR67_024289 [Solanum verrucosum]